MMKKLFITGMVVFILFFVLGTVVWFGFEKNNHKVKTVQKEYDADDIDRLIVNTDTADISVSPGDKFKFVYKGKNKLNVSTLNQTLQIAEVPMTTKRMLDVNPFKNNHGDLKIEVPSSKLNELKVTTSASNMDIEEINSTNATLWNEEHGEINLNNSHFEQTQIRGYETFVNVNDSTLVDSDVSLEQGAINVEETQVNNSVFKAVEGMINFRNIPAECALKASIKNGDILLQYKEVPKNVMLKLMPDQGKALIKNDHLKQGKNGDGDRKVELYTSKGDITVK